VLLKRGMRVNSTIPTTTLYVYLPPVVVRLGASLSRREFYKSMTTFSDHRVWQDVYPAKAVAGKTAKANREETIGSRTLGRNVSVGRLTWRLLSSAENTAPHLC
jgi:hypothetical protein